ncbi:MAG: putative UDP-glucuronat epimerase [Candidatus Moranbacteria bacterium GW2011_GWE1_49_15]|nr:MAG: putative UDP-glucuronat epimerase [Candidatus Moranbacteria bacterium GW2011_GWE1_49_15]
MAYFKFTNLISQGKPIEVYNEGKMLRDFTYIDDIVAGILTILDADLKCEVMNIGADKPEELGRYIEVLEKSLGIVAEKIMKPMQPGDVPRTMADVAKLRKMGWEPKVKIEEGLKNFADWYKEYYKI